MYFGLNHSTRESVEQLVSFVAQYADEKYSTWPFSSIHPPILFGTPLIGPCPKFAKAHDLENREFHRSTYKSVSD